MATSSKGFMFSEEQILYDWHTGRRLPANFHGAVLIFNKIQPNWWFNTHIDKTNGERVWIADHRDA